jgi:hypothetical protein
MSAAFQYNLKRRPFLAPFSLPVTESEPNTHNKRLKGDTFGVTPGAPWVSVQGLLSESYVSAIRFSKGYQDHPQLDFCHSTG